MLLGGVYAAVNAPQGKDGSASDVWGPQKRSVEARDLERSMRRFGITLNWHPNHPVRSVSGTRATRAIRGARARPLMLDVRARALQPCACSAGRRRRSGLR